MRTGVVLNEVLKLEILHQWSQNNLVFTLWLVVYKAMYTMVTIQQQQKTL